MGSVDYQDTKSVRINLVGRYPNEESDATEIKDSMQFTTEAKKINHMNLMKEVKDLYKGELQDTVKRNRDRHTETEEHSLFLD